MNPIKQWWNTVSPWIMRPFVNTNPLTSPAKEPLRNGIEAKPQIFPDNNEVLATLYSEAQGQPPEGIQAVFNTIQNRSSIKSRPWVDTVRVPGQYSGYGNSDYNNAMRQSSGEQVLSGDSLKNYEMMRKMMETQYNGQDVSGGATHYLNKKRTMNMYGKLPSWLTDYAAVNQPAPIFLKKIGDHSFYNNIAPYGR